MKYSILGFNQKKLIENNIDCDLLDLLLLNYIIYAQANPNMQHILDKNNVPYVWLYHDHILEDLPILNICSGTLNNRLLKLKQKNYISSITVANGKGQGSKTYYNVTPMIYNMIYETTSQNNDVVDRPHHEKMMSNNEPHHEKMMSNNILINNNESNIDIKENLDFTNVKSKDEDSSNSIQSFKTLEKINNNPSPSLLKEKDTENVYMDVKDLTNNEDKKDDKSVAQPDKHDIINEQIYYKLTDGKLMKKTSKSPKLLKEYIQNLKEVNGVQINGQFTSYLMKWYYGVAVGITSVIQLERKLEKIFEECNNDLTQVIQAIDNAYMNNWKAFYAPKQYKTNSISNQETKLKSSDFFNEHGRYFSPALDGATSTEGELISF